MHQTVRKIFLALHLYLGLISGIVVSIVCITGCLYIFKDEINDLRQPWKFVTAQQQEMLLPTQAIAIADQEIPEMKATAVTYGESTDAIMVDYIIWGQKASHVYINPYDGEVLKVIHRKTGDFEFFSFILNGHRYLWLPREIGRPVVGTCVILFLITLVTGMMLWWPKYWSRKTIRRSFTIKKGSSFWRLNFDLHHVLGAYAMIILCMLCLTGLVWSFQWYSTGLYYITSGGKELKPYTLPQSDTLQITKALQEPLDKLYQQLRQEEPGAKTLYIVLPYNESAVFRVSLEHVRRSYYRTDNLFFDQYTLQPLEGSGPYAGKYKEASAPDKLRRMNLELHDGRIFGIWSKIIVFLASLTGASLPITGMLIWYKKRFSFRHRKLRATR
ncbi:MAG: PepSY domain-containing protein [Tannerellaceae bacterium]|nr:PepSY domain-containing protein [Tannerellaceae bacterium]